MRTTFFLLKKLDVATAATYVTPSTKGMKTEEIGHHKAEDGTVCTIFSQYRHEQAPKWFSFVKDSVDPKYYPWLRNRNAAALIIISTKIKDSFRFFAVSLGQGHHMLSDDLVESDFGKIATLNSVRKIKVANSREIGVNAVQKRLASNSEVELGRIGVQLDYEILTGVSGRCEEESLGTRIGGEDSLQLNSSITLETLGAKCRKLFAASKDDRYKTEHPQVERMKTVKDDHKETELCTELLNAINSRQRSMKISVAAPDLIDYEVFDEYHMTGCETSTPEMTLEALYDMLGDRQITMSGLKERIKIQARSCTDDSLKSKQEPLIAYLRFEVDDETNGLVYVLSGRKWYVLSRNYVETVRNDLKQVLEPYSGPTLMPWPRSLPPYPPKDKPGEIAWHEGFYNLQYHGPADFLFMDRDNYTLGEGGGHDQIEISDFFYHPSAMHFCVKRRHKSQTLSHLFSQGSVSADLFSRSKDYRTSFYNDVSARWPNAKVELLDRLTFVYCIALEDPPKDAIDALPLFSQINLLRHAGDIRARRYGVQLCTIKLVDDLHGLDKLSQTARDFLKAKTDARAAREAKKFLAKPRKPRKPRT
jgi:uncharacterized protein (TIGR04141 family)